MTEPIKTEQAPKRICLRRKEISGHQTWVESSGFGGEVEYVRADLSTVQPKIKSLTPELEAELQAIEARVNAATPGPWSERDPNVSQGKNITIDTISPQGYRGAVCSTLNFADAMSFKEGQERCDLASRNDANFIAHARTDIPRLIEIIRQRSTGDELDAEIGRIQNGVRDHVIKLTGVPDSMIDGAGCDSGDPLDFICAEIAQGINFLIDKLSTADHLRQRSAELLKLQQAIGWICDAADAAYNEDSENVRIHEIFNIAAQAAGLTRRLPDEYHRFTEDE